eukprot:13644609-Alexandrium_andersonii.AAC.1
MSASLVGSEMCIRDRHKPGQSGVAKAARRKTNKAGRQGDRYRGKRRRRGCLLYTSDAADDM